MPATVPAFAVVCTTTIYCRDTDAIQGSGSFVCKRFPTRSEAEAWVEDRYEEGDEDSFEIVLKPFVEGEGELNLPRYSLLELYNHDQAVMRDGPFSDDF